MDEVRQSGYAGLLPAGVVLTGGASLLPGMRTIANKILKMPARIAQPEDISGMIDMLRSPAFSTSVGLLRLGLIMDIEDSRRTNTRNERRSRVQNSSGGIGRVIGGIFKRFLPEDENSP
jgi:cell division protein FtsA